MTPALMNSAELALWITQGAAVHLRAVTEGGAPIRLSSEETRDLALKLLELAELAALPPVATY